MRLENKIAVITGGNSGIGLGIAQEFKAEGAKGIIVGRNPKTLHEAENQLQPNFMAIRQDLTETSALDAVFKTTQEKFGNIDVLVVNAGGAIGNGSLGDIATTTEDDFDRMVNANLKSTFFTVQKALPYLKDGASIILIGSIATYKSFDSLSVYSACKAGVRSLTKTISRNLLDRNIRVNSISPGTIDTPLFGKLGLPEEVSVGAREGFVDLIPVKRIGLPRDIGKAAVYLASDESTFVLGADIIVDGGVVNL